ncbi:MULTISPECIES: hypothetical protein [unclassified Mesorhizobium]|uniref:hypothetical protein n=1 Tax=unclassified Mesorhizobium TaxID=325217 RepID=UPI0013DED92A|nr:MULTISPECIES: hypothetical protein [unclassified Mesorhizobium]
MPAATFRQVLEEKQFRGGDAKPLINAAAMVLDSADGDAQPLGNVCGHSWLRARFLPGLSVFHRSPWASLWLFLPHLGDRLRGMGYIALHNGSARAWRGGKSALNCMDGNPLPR